MWEKTVPKVSASGRTQDQGHSFSHTEQPSPVNNIFIFFFGGGGRGDVFFFSEVGIGVSWFNVSSSG